MSLGMRILVTGIVLGLILGASPAMAAKPVREKPVTQLPQWPDFISRQTQALQSLSACESQAASCTSNETQRWAALIDSLKTQNRLRQIITVNKWFNRVPYKHDEYAYQALDYWADTLQLLKDKGDCEDYSLAKYYTLRELGFNADEMKIMMVYDQDSFTNHSVLMIYINGTRYMLDSKSDDTDPYEMDTRYKPIYGFNETTAWFYQ